MKKGTNQFMHYTREVSAVSCVNLERNSFFRIFKQQQHKVATSWCMSLSARKETFQFTFWSIATTTVKCLNDQLFCSTELLQVMVAQLFMLLLLFFIDKYASQLGLVMKTVAISMVACMRTTAYVVIAPLVEFHVANFYCICFALLCFFL